METTDYSSAASDTDAEELDEEVMKKLYSPSLSRSNAPLDREWCVYADRVSHDTAPMTKEEYLSSLKVVFRFKSMAEYHEKFEIHKLKSLLKDPEVSLRVFQGSVVPVWEAPENKAGGKFVLSLVGNAIDSALQTWSTLLTIMCQGRIGACDELMGAVYSPKDWGTMIAMWNRNSSERKQVTRIMRRLRKLFETSSVKYLTHLERPVEASARSGKRDKALKRSLVMESPLTVTSIAPAITPPSVSVFEWKQIMLVGVLFVVITLVIVAAKFNESAEL